MWLSGFTLVLLPETSSANILYRPTRCLCQIIGRRIYDMNPSSSGLDPDLLVLVRMDESVERALDRARYRVLSSPSFVSTYLPHDGSTTLTFFYVLYRCPC